MVCVRLAVIVAADIAPSRVGQLSTTVQQTQAAAVIVPALDAKDARGFLPGKSIEGGQPNPLGRTGTERDKFRIVVHCAKLSANATLRRSVRQFNNTAANLPAVLWHPSRPSSYPRCLQYWHRARPLAYHLRRYCLPLFGAQSQN